MKRANQNGRLHTLPDYLRRGLKVVFVGYNPGLRSARLGHYYAGPGNQFWPLLFEAGLVPEPLGFADDSRLIGYGMGFTDIVKQASRVARDLRTRDLRSGCALLRRKIRRYRPRALAFVGKRVYKQCAGRPVELGPQPETVDGARVFVLPSTSGANAAVSRREKLEYFQQLRRWLGSISTS